MEPLKYYWVHYTKSFGHYTSSHTTCITIHPFLYVYIEQGKNNHANLTLDNWKLIGAEDYNLFIQLYPETEYQEQIDTTHVMD